MESYYKPNPRWPGVPHHTQADLVFHFQGTLPKAAADTGGGAAQSQLSSLQPLCASCVVTEQTSGVYLVKHRVFITIPASRNTGAVVSCPCSSGIDTQSQSLVSNLGSAWPWVPP